MSDRDSQSTGPEPRSRSAAGREIELKFDLDREAALLLRRHPLLRDALGSPRTSSSIYYDTGKNTLRDAGVSLRVRRTGDAFVQTVKAQTVAAAGLFDRAEWESTLDSPEPDLDAAALYEPVLARPEVRKSVGPLFETRISRQSCLLERSDSQVELVIDEGEVVAGKKSLPLVEVELELKSGSPRALFKVAREIGQIVPLRLGVLTKSERGTRLASRRTSRASKAEPIALSPGMTAGELFRTVTFACLRHFRINEPLIVAARDTDALHQARVALRRLRSALSLFKPYLSDPSVGHFQQQLRGVAAKLGHARNLDVLLRRRSEDLPKDVRRGIVALRSEAYGGAIDLLRSRLIDTTMIDLVEWLAIDAPVSIDENTGLAADILAPVVLDRFWKKVRRGGRRLTALDDEERHELRIAGKKLRYAAEFFSSLVPEAAAERRDEFLSALSELQDVLGDLNDIATERQIEGDLAKADIKLPKRKAAAVTINDGIEAADLAFRRLATIGPYWR